MVINDTTHTIWKLLEEVPDPEVPVLNVLDLGVVRSVSQRNDNILIEITPTYTGCPAMDMIEVNIRSVLQNHGFENIEIKTILSPAWTTDWMTEVGKQKLKEYGIAPPQKSANKYDLMGLEADIACPQCDSTDTVMISQFGSTACKALFKCKTCLEPFDYFKCH